MSDKDLTAFNTIVSALRDLEPEVQQRTLHAVLTMMGIQLPASIQQSSSNKFPSENSALRNGASFTEDRTMSPKEFLRDKMPKTDIERIACLAYYLTHYREQQFFKTLDLSALNTEAAQPKFSNAAQAVDNATKNGYLVQGTKGNKQISSAGETYVQALPDRLAAKESISNIRPKRRTKKTSKVSHHDSPDN